MKFSQKFKSKKVFSVALTVLLLICLVLGLSGCKKDTKKVSNKKSSATTSQKDKGTSELPENNEDGVQEETVPPEKKLVVSSPAKTDITTTESKYAISGRCDPEHPLYLNGEQVTIAEDGSFGIDVSLKEGVNTFTLEHKGAKTTYTIRYRYVILQSCQPSAAKKLDGNSVFAVSVVARAGSKVTASFAGTTITLKKDTSNGVSAGDTDFATFTGNFTMPAGELKDKLIGKVSFTATFNSKTETATSANITCKKDAGLANKIYVAEVVAYQAETFDATGTDDTSRPTNNYLPKGTVDYCDYNIVYGNNDYSYYKLRCGRRIYINKKNAPETSRTTVSKRYEGTLPDHNELSLVSLGIEGKHTVMKLSPLWKAPFLLDILPQNYTRPSTQDYRITAQTYTYVEIQFCYATVLEGDFTIPEDNPLFSRAEVTTKNGAQTLRLYLKKKGGFYGWEAEYDSNGNLCFYFLNPAKVSYAENAYGTDLTGVTVFIDVGHGGRDPGALGSNKNYTEAERNLNLALKLKAELESIGAKVVMTRTTNDNGAISADAKCELLRKTKPDYCIAIHHDSDKYSSSNGYGAFYSTPFSYEAAKFVNDRTVQAAIYKRVRALNWHYYYTARVTTCPVVLTENGFMSNAGDYSGILSAEVTDKKVKAMTQGIVDYFNLINK